MSSFSWAASNAISHTEPSSHSPSPTMAYILCASFFLFAAIAKPHAIQTPCPNEPVDTSTPGTSLCEIWQENIPPLSPYVFNNSSSKNPIFAKATYTVAPLCPLERTILSLLGSFGFLGFICATSAYKTAIASAHDKIPPRWEACAWLTIFIAFFRISYANSSLRTIFHLPL